MKIKNAFAFQKKMLTFCLLPLSVMFFFLLVYADCSESAEGVLTQKKIVYIPLDNRPVCYDFVQQLGNMAGINLVMPSKEILSGTGDEDRVEKLWAWVFENAKGTDSFIVSLDTVLYGGLVSSRTHQFTAEVLQNRLNKIKKLKEHNSVPVYAFISIMRTPTTNSSVEKPEYYGMYGADIFKISKLADRVKRGLANSMEIKRLHGIKEKIPSHFLDDFLQRRDLNHQMTRKSIGLVDEGVIDCLVVSRDDCAPFGFSRLEQRALNREIINRAVGDKVYSLAGLDECGAVLFARAVNQWNGYVPQVHIKYGTPKGPDIIPRYEDIPLKENIPIHINCMGGQVTKDINKSDLILIVNSPQQAVGEAVHQDPHIFNRQLVGQVKDYILNNQALVVADVNYANGADHGFLTALSEKGLLYDLAGYSGWNTAGNTIGLSLSQGILYNYLIKNDTTPLGWRLEHQRLLWTRLLTDWGYQAVIRPKLVKKYLAGRGAAARLNPELETRVEQEILKELNPFAHKNLTGFYKPFRVTSVNLPWHRMFDLSVMVE